MEGRGGTGRAEAHERQHIGRTDEVAARAPQTAEAGFGLVEPVARGTPGPGPPRGSRDDADRAADRDLERPGGDHGLWCRRPWMVP